MSISDEQFASITRLDAERRYEYLISRICEAKQVWALRDADGFVVMGDSSGEEYIPVWPDERFASAWASGPEKPEAIPLEAWTERWLPGLERDRSGVAFFPVEGDSGVVVPLDEHRDDIGAELDRRKSEM